MSDELLPSQQDKAGRLPQTPPCPDLLLLESSLVLV